MRPRDINRPSRASRRTRDVRPGDRVGANERYLVCEMINRGGTATVYRGLDRERGDEEVALKVIDSGEGARVRVPLSAVKREVKYATKLMMRDEMAGRDNAGVVRLLCVRARCLAALSRDFVSIGLTARGLNDDRSASQERCESR